MLTQLAARNLIDAALQNGVFKPDAPFNLLIKGTVLQDENPKQQEEK